MTLSTLAKLKSHLDINTSNVSEDARLNIFLNASSTAIESYCDRKFEQASKTEYHHGRRMNFIMPREWPIVSIASIHVDNDRVFGSSTLIDPSEYFVSDRENTILYKSHWPQGYSNIKLVYTYGYATVPGDVELACLWAAEWFYKHRERKDMGRTSVGKGDESVGILASMPPMILQLIHPYKRIEVPDLNSPVSNL